MTVRVLLLGPLPGRDPLSGDTSYTVSLLEAPPPGVTYTDYGTALEDGTLVLRGRSRRRRGLAETGLFLARCVELLLRRLGVMFREPTVFAHVDAEAFDVVHTHLFSLRQVGSAVPVVSSAGYPLTEHYRFRERWSERRLRLAERAEEVWARLLRVHVPWLHQVRPSVMTAYSTAACDYLMQHGARESDVRVIGTGLPPLALPASRSSGTSLLFAGRDFERKGGPLAVEAFRLLRAAGHDVTLTVATAASSAPARELDITWVLDADRDQVLQDVLPEVDVLIAPTECDCGVPYTVLEALQSGVPAVMTDLRWLDPRLSAPAVTLVRRDAQQIADAVAALLEPAALTAARAAARRAWFDHFTLEALGAQLAAAYDAVAAQ